MRSFTRSIGAAAVFETAAETPPTIIHYQCDARWKSVQTRALIASFCRATAVIATTALHDGGAREAEGVRTQEVDEEGRHAQDRLLLLLDCGMESAF